MRGISTTASVLDVGCGEGMLSDFLTDSQKQKYLGIDVSETAIRKAKEKRKTVSFIHSTAEEFVPPNGAKYNVIVFSEMLYYVNHMEIIKKYSQFLHHDGVIAISVWFSDKVSYLKDNIFDDARNILASIENFHLVGNTNQEWGKSRVSFHIESFKLKNNAIVRDHIAQNSTSKTDFTKADNLLSEKRAAFKDVIENLKTRGYRIDDIEKSLEGLDPLNPDAHDTDTLEEFLISAGFSNTK